MTRAAMAKPTPIACTPACSWRAATPPSPTKRITAMSALTAVATAAITAVVVRAASAPKKSIVSENQQLNLAIRLIGLGARMAVLEAETDLSHERLVRL